jgi:hypothetical protein
MKMKINLITLVSVVQIEVRNVGYNALVGIESLKIIAGAVRKVKQCNLNKQRQTNSQG